MSNKLNEAIIGLANSRNEKEGAQRNLLSAAKALANLPESKAYERMRDTSMEWGKIVRKDEEVVRLLAIDAYTDSVGEGEPNKSPHPAVSIAIGKHFVTAPDEALLTYCIDNLTTVLQVNKKKLLAIAKATGDIVSDGLDLVTVHDDPKARIKSDLSKWEAE